MTDPAPPAEGQTFGASRSRSERRANRREARKRRQREWLLGGVVAVVLIAAIVGRRRDASRRSRDRPRALADRRDGRHGRRGDLISSCGVGGRRGARRSNGSLVRRVGGGVSRRVAGRGSAGPRVGRDLPAHGGGHAGRGGRAAGGRARRHIPGDSDRHPREDERRLQVGVWSCISPAISRLSRRGWRLSSGPFLRSWVP